MKRYEIDLRGGRFIQSATIVITADTMPAEEDAIPMALTLIDPALYVNEITELA